MGDQIKSIIKTKIKSLILSKLIPILIPVAVFIIAIGVMIAVVTIQVENASANSTESSADGTTSTDSSSFQQFKTYLRGWEAGGNAAKNKDGTKYIIVSDGAGHPTVGYGVDIYNGGYEEVFKKAGYTNLNMGAEIDIDFVDGLEEQEIQEGLNDVNAETKGLNLKVYQTYALVSRYYNCGPSGWKTARNGEGTFKQTYNKYWKSGDDKYNQKEKVDYNHNLYSKYMYLPNTSEGEFMQGLENRRKSEWLLFQTGFFDGNGQISEYCKLNDDSSSSETESSNTSTNTNIKTQLTGKKKAKMEKLIARAIEIANDVDYQYYQYSQSKRNEAHYFDCSSFCARLYKKYFDIEIPGSTSSYGSDGYIGKVGEVDLQPGDILWREGHVELYIGNNKRAGAHTSKKPAKDQISIETGTSDFTKVYRFVTN